MGLTRSAVEAPQHFFLNYKDIPKFQISNMWNIMNTWFVYGSTEQACYTLL